MAWERIDKPQLRNATADERLYFSNEGELIFETTYDYHDSLLFMEADDLPVLFRFLADHLGYEIEEDEG